VIANHESLGPMALSPSYIPKDWNSQYLLMLDIFVKCVDAVKGKSVEAGMSWQADTQPLAKKFFFHLGTAFKLQEGTFLHLPSVGQFPFIDFPAISILVRSALESYLTFQFIFVQPNSIEEKRFRHTVWAYSGLRDRQRFKLTTKEGYEKLESEKPRIENLKRQIHDSSFYAELPKDLKKKVMKGGRGWRLGKQWNEIAEASGTHREYFVSLYSYLSSYAHSGYLSVLQLSQAQTERDQQSLCSVYTFVGLALMSHFIIAYCGQFKEAQAVLEANPAYNDFLQVHYVSADDWEKQLNKVKGRYA
jgi:hypothetical protein